MEFLSQQGIPFTEKDVTSDPEAVEYLIRNGVQSTPAIRVGEKLMVGFRKDELLAMIRG